jgi:hypothetical protein
MVKFDTTKWTVEELIENINCGEATFEHIIQRKQCWCVSRKCLLINSLLEKFPIPAFYALENENGSYDMLDGQQRSTTIYDFVNDKFTLANITPPTTLNDGTEYELTDKKYSDLTEELQQRILDTNLDIVYFEEITDDEVKELFYRLNNGKPFTSFELSRIKAVSLEQIHETAKHDIFQQALTKSQLAKFGNEEFVVKSWVMLNQELPSLAMKDIRPLMETAVISDEQVCELYDIYDKFLRVYGVVNSTSKKAAKTMFNRTHFMSLVPILRQSITDQISDEDMANRIIAFYPEKNKSICEKYNGAVTSRKIDKESIQERHNALMAHYKKSAA